MKVEVIDGRTYMVGEKVFEVGEVVELTAQEINDLDTVRNLEREVNALKQKIVDTCHMADKNFAPELGEMAHSLSACGVEYSYRITMFINSLQRRLGGLLPVMFDDDRTKVTVRERSAGPNGLEDVNYTVASMKRAIRLSVLEDQRTVAIELAGAKDKVLIDISRRKSLGVQPVDFKTDAELTHDDFMAAMVKIIPENLFLSDTIVFTKGTYNSAVSMTQPPHDGGGSALRAGLDKLAEALKPTRLFVVNRKPANPTKNERESILLSYMDKDRKIMGAEFMADPASQALRFVPEAWVQGQFHAPGGPKEYGAYLIK